jgi:hypothetical protein
MVRPSVVIGAESDNVPHLIGAAVGKREDVMRF